MDGPSGGEYESALELLRLIQVDYRRAREQLQDVMMRFGERESVAGKRLRETMDAAGRTRSSRGGGVAVADGWVLGEWELGSEDRASRVAVAERGAPTLEVYCLGPFQVRVGWEKIEHWRSGKAKALMKYLVAQRGRPVAKDVLMEALWPGCEPSLANNNLKAAIRVLRETLGVAHEEERDFAWVTFEGGSYMINPEGDQWLDTAQFEYHWARGWRLERDGRLPEAVAEYEAAEALYRGDYLEDDPYEEWTLLRREALKDTYLTILGKLADYCMSVGDLENAVGHCQKIIARDCCREDAYRRLMICHSRLGHRNRALAWYVICEKTIKAELDLPPDGQTKAMYRRLLNDEAL
jgi:DNA-binding SARP family transcriptional activator